ncbi:glycosyltransferase [Acinetobacter boissieri]|uniref:Glycosyltransferase involved in cell wall bisynthesis n=1 Tax=Acinetobacter boissieri TaxID=1219383 RepID=A0A1G6JI21_9GAMM|nr:glycosyltransferase [Acinetobacter boissieri]SDC18379.1 Glycosyltransferase involved in cell wall bisynthesis [Acinetobacter boissieri]
MQLSLIIPIYKVEAYIEACLHSVCMQLPLHGVEVLLVNDGTPDQSMQLARAYLAQQQHAVQQRFQCIDQHNMGLSGARNTGLAHATGQYVAFLDSDDLLKANYFDEILAILSHHSNLDIVQFQAERINDNGVVSPFLTAMPYTGQHTLTDDVYLSIFNRSAWFSWLRVYKRDLFDGISFPVGRNYEDAYTTPFLFFKAQQVYFSSEILLQYRINLHGITATKSEKNINDLGQGAMHYLAHLKQYPVLAPTLVSISQSYINDSISAEGYRRAYARWSTLKPQISQAKLEHTFILNRGNRLFLRFGVGFLMFDRTLRALGLK